MARTASATSRTTSPAAARNGDAATECLVVTVGQRQKPSWCLAVRISVLKPPALAARAHCMASSALGLKIAGNSLPSPQSRSVKVFTPKWAKSASSSRCQCSWAGVGRGRAAPALQRQRGPAAAAARARNSRRASGRSGSGVVSSGSERYRVTPAYRPGESVVYLCRVGAHSRPFNPTLRERTT